MLKQVRIDAYGKIVDADRDTHTTRAAACDGPDRVQWLRVPGVTAKFTVRFVPGPFQPGSPFRPGAQDIDVRGDPPQEVTQAVGRYKYSVLDSTGRETDDPDVIIDS